MTEKKEKVPKKNAGQIKFVQGKSENPANAPAISSNYPELFQPIKIGTCEIKNRIVMAPMNTVFSMGK